MTSLFTRRRLWRTLLACACGLAAALPAAAQQFTMKIGTATVNDAQHEWMKQYKARIEKASGGRIKADIYPASQLGPIPRMIEGLQLGTVEVFVSPTDFFVGVDPRFMLFGVPAMFQDRAQAAATLQDPTVREPLMALAEPRGIVGLSAFVLGTPAYLAKKPIRTLADFKGLKLRINASEVERESVQRLGASATPMPLSEVIPALQTGVIDGTRSVPAVYVNFKYGDLAKVMTVTNDSYLVTFVGISKMWLSRLPADLQKVVVDEARAMEAGIQDWANNYEDSMLAQWQRDGGEVVRLPAADQAELLKRMQGVGDKVVQDRPALKPLHDRLQATAKITSTGAAAKKQMSAALDESVPVPAEPVDAAPPGRIAGLARGLVGLLLLLGVALMFANVVARQFFASPFYWAEEVAVYLNIWCVFLGVALVTRDNAHLRMDLLLNALPRQRARWLRGASWLGLVVASGVVTACSASLLLQLYQADLRSVAVGLPMVVPHLAVFLGFGATCIVALVCRRRYLDAPASPRLEDAGT